MASDKQIPAYVGYGTFKNQITGLEHVPSVIDNSVYSSMGGSTRNAFFASMRFFDLIDENGVPSDDLKTLAESGGDDAIWKNTMKRLIENRYSDAQLSTLKNGSINALKKTFEADAGQSLIPSACRFLITAAKDVGVPVSGTIAKGKVGGGRRRSGGGGTPRHNTASSGSGNEDKSKTPKGMIPFPIHIPGKNEGRILVPEDFDEDDLPLAEAAFAYVQVWAKRKKSQGGEP